MPFITSIVTENCEEVNSVAGIFAGTGSVASAFTDKRLITNDNLYSNYHAKDKTKSTDEVLIVNY
ncbi:MAG: DNA adenine methylase [Clostridiales Family XIII bacterium]|nr:DNA adenine methylase [Clostridiales Family XIII bacterium]